jgi:hypothetical protein
MKSMISLSFLLMVLSCGKSEVISETGIGETKSSMPISISSNELTSLTAICQAISQKTSALPSFVNGQYIFTFSKKECTESTFGSSSDMTTILENKNGSYKFVENSGNYFYFSDVETTDDGSMSKICEKIKTGEPISSPITFGTESLFFSLGGISSEDCNTLANQTCVLIQKGTSVSEGLSRIHTKEWIRFDLSKTSGKLGFFTLKKTLTSNGCATGDSQGSKAILK